METNVGVRLDRMIRAGACGTWWTGSTAGGHALGLLQLESNLIAVPAARERAAAAVAAVREANPPGVLRTTELVAEAKRAWLVVATPPAPTVADVIAQGARLGPGVAVGIAVDVAHALHDLHAAGLGHGDLTADTVIVTPAGAANLVEVGLLAALRDTPTDVGNDSRAWARLARDLTSVASSPEAEALLAAASTAELRDLATAARRLAAPATIRPDSSGRESSVAHGPATAPATRVPAPRSTVDLLRDRVRSFGRGAPDPAVAAPSRARTRPSGSHRSLRAIQVAAVLVTILLGVGAAFWWLALLR